MDGDMFCFIHEAVEWVMSPYRSVKYSGGCHESIDVNCNMSHAEFVGTVCGVLDIQPPFS